jgi:hypothetical protein
MSRGRGSRPRRGPAGPNVLVTGDTGIAAGPQGGAKPGASESGNLEAREFGVPQADIPGGLKHLVNPESLPARTHAKPPRPADYHKEHGVEPDDWGPYAVPADESEHRAARRPVPEPKWNDAVPVYVVESPGEKQVIRALITEGPVTVPTGTIDPVRIAVRDPHRTKFWIVNETTASGAGAATPGPRIGDWETTSDGRGMLIPAAQMKDFNGQDDIYLINTSGNPVTVSFGYETEVEAAGAEP